MKTLYLLRHAKSSWDNSDLDDFDRPLNERGKKAAPFMGEYMTRNGFDPELILSSPALRARETARLAKEGGDLTAEIKYDERIYDASPKTLRQVASEIEDVFGSVMMVGHNPGTAGFIKLLTGRQETVPTAALTVIDLDISKWSEIRGECGNLRALIRPKDEMKM